jgi:hypothetical protein
VPIIAFHIGPHSNFQLVWTVRDKRFDSSLSEHFQPLQLKVATLRRSRDVQLVSDRRSARHGRVVARLQECFAIDMSDPAFGVVSTITAPIE